MGAIPEGDRQRVGQTQRLRRRDFVGWYHAKTADIYGVAKDDTYNLYLAYYFGWTGYEKGAWKEKPGLQDYARETEQMAIAYAKQLRKCGQAA